MKSFTTLFIIAMLALTATPFASAKADTSNIDNDLYIDVGPCSKPGSTDCDEKKVNLGIVGGSYCVNTGATCGPNDNSWAAVTVWGPGIFVCVNTYTGELLCTQRPPPAKDILAVLA